MTALYDRCHSCLEFRRLYSPWGDLDWRTRKPLPRTTCESCCEGMAERAAEALVRNGFTPLERERILK